MLCGISSLILRIVLSFFVASRAARLRIGGVGTLDAGGADRCETECSVCLGANANESHQASCYLRRDACQGNFDYFGRYNLFNEPCKAHSWDLAAAGNSMREIGHVFGAAFGVPDALCRDDARLMDWIFLNPTKFKSSAADQVANAMLNSQLYNMFEILGCGLHASYSRLQAGVQKKAKQPLSPSIIVLGITTLAEIALQGLTLLPHTTWLNMMLRVASPTKLATLLLRKLWFGEVGNEMLGVRLRVKTRLKELPRIRKCRYDEKEVWEFDRVLRVDDRYFSRFSPGAYYVLRCVAGSCETRIDGNTTRAPPVLLSVRHELEDMFVSALHRVIVASNSTYAKTETSFRAFLQNTKNAQTQISETDP